MTCDSENFHFFFNEKTLFKWQLKKRFKADVKIICNTDFLKYLIEKKNNENNSSIQQKSIDINL